MKRKIGWLIIMLFGLTMLTEVAVLPLFTSFASKFECSVIAELTDFEEQEKLESLSELQLAIVAILPEFQLFTTEEPLELAGNPKNPDIGLSTEVFLEYRSIRI